MRRALTLLIALAIVPLLLTQMAISVIWLQSRRALAEENNYLVALAVARVFKDFVHDVNGQELAAGIALEWFEPQSSELMSKYLRANARELPAVRVWDLVDRAGKIVASTEKSRIGGALDIGADWYREMVAGRRGYVTDLLADRPVNRPAFLITQRIEDEKGHLLGVSVAEIDGNALAPLFQPIERTEGGMFGLVDRKGTLVYIAPEIELADRNFIPIDPPLRTALSTGEAATEVFTSGVDFRQRLGTRLPVHDTGWVAGSSKPVSALVTPVMRTLALIALLNLTVIGLSILAAGLLGKQVLRSVRILQTHSQAVGQGDLARRTEMTGIRELEDLARSFNLMGANLQDARTAQQQANAALEQRVAERTTELRETNQALEREIVERQRSQAALQEQSRILEAFFAHTLGPIMFLDKSLRLLRVNQACLRSFHQPVLEFPGYLRLDYLSRDGVAQIEEALHTGKPCEAFARPFLSPEHPEWGTTYWDWSLVPVLDDRGEIDFLIFSLRDVTERKAAEERLRESEGKLRAIFDHTFLFVGLLTPDGLIVEANRGSLELLGTEKSGVVGKAFWETGWWQHSAPMRERLRAGVHAAATGQFVRFEATHPRRDGSLIYVDFSLTPVRDEGGRVVFLVPEGRDITERKLAEAELGKYRDHLEELVTQRTAELELANQRLETQIVQRKQAVEALERTTRELVRSNRELEQFAYIASHDLQEPLRVISGYLQLLDRRYRGRFDSDADQFIQYAMDGSKHMQQLISDLLEYSRVGRRGREFEPTESADVLRDALGGLQRRIEETGAAITCDPLPAVMADRTQLIRLFQNLIGNAVTFHGDRAPQIHVAARRDGEHWQFSVRDNGIGIERQYWEQIFVIFQRLHTRQKYAGTGIGLAICKKIVERHGGRIWLDSEPGQGSTFYFTIRAVEERS